MLNSRVCTYLTVEELAKEDVKIFQIAASTVGTTKIQNLKEMVSESGGGAVYASIVDVWNLPQSENQPKNRARDT